MRKCYVNVTTQLIIRANDDVNIGTVLSDMDYLFRSQTVGADIEDMELIDWEIKDSK